MKASEFEEIWGFKPPFPEVKEYELWLDGYHHGYRDAVWDEARAGKG